MRQGQCGFAVWALGALLALAGAGRAGEYQFSRINPPGFEVESGAPAINDRGEVAFWARQGTLSGIYISDGQAIRTIADTQTSFIELGRSPALNNAGQAAFSGRPAGANHGVYRADGTTLTTIASSDFVHYGSLAIADNATVAFADSFDMGGSLSVASPAGAIATVYTRSLFTTFSSPVLSPGGTLAYTWGGTSSPEPGHISIGGAVIDGPIVAQTLSGDPDPTQESVTKFRFVAANDQGNFIVSGDEGNYAGSIVMRRDDAYWILGSTQAIGPVAINNRDMALSLLDRDKDSERIAYGVGDLSSRLIGRGDALDGSIVTDLEIWTDPLNENGQIAFRATLADGSSGIYRADPVVPEPGAGVGLLAAGWMLLRRTTRRPR